MEEPTQLPTVEPPRGMFPAHVDEKGRAKLPVPIQRYFGALTEKKLFVTSTNRSTAQVYPIAAWKENEKFLDDYRDDPEAAENTTFSANEFGVETEMDGQGRILMPPELRRHLGIENQQVRVYFHRGHLEILSEKTFEARRQKADEKAATDHVTMMKAGMK